jgi:Bacterial archaeo-eukaryotic release factor family 11
VALHTDIPTRSALERLLGTRGEPCVSIYLATSPLTQDTQRARIALKNLAADATGQLEQAGAERGVVPELREALDDLVGDDDYWAEQARSLAIFASRGTLRTFRLPNRLRDAVEVGDRFYVKPMLRAVTFPQAGFVLALAAGSVRLVEVLHDGPPFTVDVPGLPRDAATASGNLDRSLSSRLEGAEGQKIRLRQFARKVDRALRGVLNGLELPLILAATEPLDSIYRSMNTYPHLVDSSLGGSPEGMSDEDLAAAARTVLDDVHARELSAIHDLFRLRSSHGRASTDLAMVARAATYGAVDTLIVDIDEKVPGRVDEESGAVTLSDDDASSYGVIDEIARRVLLSGGRVLAVRRPDVPDGAAVAAILRYAL